MTRIPWPELKAKLLSLPPMPTPMTVERLGVVVDQETFLKTHMRVCEIAQTKDIKTQSGKNYKLYIALPHYDRLLAYYFMVTQL